MICQISWLGLKNCINIYFVLVKEKSQNFGIAKFVFTNVTYTDT